MSSMVANGPHSVQRQGEEWREAFSPPAPPSNQGGPPWGLMVTGLVAVGLGILVWNYLGPDIRRYLKIQQM